MNTISLYIKLNNILLNVILSHTVNKKPVKAWQGSNVIFLGNLYLADIVYKWFASKLQKISLSSNPTMNKEKAFTSNDEKLEKQGKLIIHHGIDWAKHCFSIDIDEGIKQVCLSAHKRVDLVLKSKKWRDFVSKSKTLFINVSISMLAHLINILCIKFHLHNCRNKYSGIIESK